MFHWADCAYRCMHRCVYVWVLVSLIIKNEESNDSFITGRQSFKRVILRLFGVKVFKTWLHRGYRHRKLVVFHFNALLKSLTVLWCSEVICRMFYLCPKMVYEWFYTLHTFLPLSLVYRIFQMHPHWYDYLWFNSFYTFHCIPFYHFTSFS